MVSVSIRKYFQSCYGYFQKKKFMSRQEKYVSEFDGFEDWHLWVCMVTKDNALVLNIVTEHYTNYQIPIKNDDF